jgi:hypothetical protein
MTHIIADRVRESASVTGTGDFTLSGAVTNFENFSDVMSNGDTCWYFSTSSAGGWEVGLGTKATGVLQRTTVFESSNADAKVNFNAGGSGTVDLSLTIPARILKINGLTGKTTPVDADELSLWDSVALTLKKLTWANLKTALGAVFSPITRTLNAQTGTTYTLVLGDAGNIVTMSNASANTLTIPPNSSVAFPVGTQIDIAQKGAGKTTIANGAGVTINNTNKSLAAQYAGVTAVKEATDTWTLYGSTIA